MLLLIYILLPFLKTLITAQKQRWEHHICTAFLQSWRWISPKEANYIWKYFYTEGLPSNSNQKENKYRYKNKTTPFSSFRHQTWWYPSGTPHEDLRKRKKQDDLPQTLRHKKGRNIATLWYFQRHSLWKAHFLFWGSGPCAPLIIYLAQGHTSWQWAGVTPARVSEQHC